MAQNPNESNAERLARLRQNSLQEQRQEFAKTGRVTKGLQRAGEAVGAQDYTVRYNDSPFSIARQLLGPNALESQVAAYAQQIAYANGGKLQSLKVGETLRIPGALVDRDARATPKFMADAANYRPGGSSVNASQSTSNLFNPQGAPASANPPAPASGMQGPPAPYFQLAAQNPTQAQPTQGPPAPYSQLAAGSVQRTTSFGSAGGGASANTVNGLLSPVPLINQWLGGNAPGVGREATGTGWQGGLEYYGIESGSFLNPESAPPKPNTSTSQAGPTPSWSANSPATPAMLASSARNAAASIYFAQNSGNRNLLPEMTSDVAGAIVYGNTGLQTTLVESGFEPTATGLLDYLGYAFNAASNSWSPMGEAQSDSNNYSGYSGENIRVYRPYGVRLVRNKPGRGSETGGAQFSQDASGAPVYEGGYGSSGLVGWGLPTSWDVDFG